ncbi:hypothetical protein GCM10029978_070750 [Actinoallomurus acanthiterrae]
MTHRSISRRDALRAGAGLTAVALGPAREAAADAPTPEQQAGQRVIFSYSGPAVPQPLLDQVRAGTAAGVIFFADNVTGLDQIASVIRRLEAARRAGPVPAPLLLMTDQEGGRIRRLPGGPLMSQKEIGAASDPLASAGRAGEAAGQLLASVGMNVNLAPVLDVHRVEGDFADRLGRSYSTDPAVCGRLGAAFVTAQQRTGVAATVKHFPGLGTAGAARTPTCDPSRSTSPAPSCSASTSHRTLRRSRPASSSSCRRGPSIRRSTRPGPPACPRSSSVSCAIGSGSGA